MKLKTAAPGQRFAFRNNYLAAIIATALLLISVTLSAQVDTTKNFSPVNTFGTQFKNLKTDSSFILANDTFKLKSTWRGISAKGDQPYFWNGIKWVDFAGAGVLDTSGHWITTVYRRSDSVFYVIGGVETFAFTDSLGAGSAIDTTNKWVQLTYVRNDSLFHQKNGSEVFIERFYPYNTNPLGYLLPSDTISISDRINLKVDSVTTNDDSTKLRYWINGVSSDFYDFTSFLTGDTTVFQTTLDSTGNPNFRVLWAANNKIRSNENFLFDSANRKLVINHNNVSIGGPNTKLFVKGNVQFAGTVTLPDLPAGKKAKQLFYDPTDKQVYVGDSTGTGGGGITEETDPLSVHVGDSAAMLTNYLNDVGYGLLRTGQQVRADSATLANYFLRRKDSLTSTNLLGYVTKTVLDDTAAAIRSSIIGYSRFGYPGEDVSSADGNRDFEMGANNNDTLTISSGNETAGNALQVISFGEQYGLKVNGPIGELTWNKGVYKFLRAAPDSSFIGDNEVTADGAYVRTVNAGRSEVIINASYQNGTKVNINGTDSLINITSSTTKKGKLFLNVNDISSASNGDVLSIVDKTTGETGWTTPTAGGGISLTDLSAISPILYDNGTGVFSFDSSDHHSIGYYDLRYQPIGSYLSSLTSVGSGLDIQSGGAGNINTINATYFDLASNLISPDFTNGLSSGSQSGWLSTTDWTTFNNKETAFTETAEEFTSSTSLSITLSNTPKSGKAEMYYLNGQLIKASNISRTGTGVTFSGFSRDSADIITAKYSY